MRKILIAVSTTHQSENVIEVPDETYNAILNDDPLSVLSKEIDDLYADADKKVSTEYDYAIYDAETHEELIGWDY